MKGSQKVSLLTLNPHDIFVYPLCSICSLTVLTLTLIFYSACALYQLYMNWTGPIGRKNQIQMSCPGQLGLPVSQMSGKRKNILFLYSNKLIQGQLSVEMQLLSLNTWNGNWIYHFRCHLIYFSSCKLN